MAETSKPWPGTIFGDAGPYNSNEWNDSWLAQSRSGGRLSRTADRNLGVFYGIANGLEPTNTVTGIDVDTGASLVDGLYHENSDVVSVPIPASAVLTSRIDIVVVRKNYQQAVTYTPGGGAPTVPPRTARITVIRGVEAGAPVAPSLTQDTTRATYWDIPIASVTVNSAGLFGSFTDLREFVDSEEKIDLLFFDFARYYNTVSAAYEDIFPDRTAPLRLLASYLGDELITYFSGQYAVKNDFIKDLEASLIVYTQSSVPGSMDIYTSVTANYGAIGQSYLTHTSGTNGTYTLTQNIIANALSLSVASAAIGDVISFDCLRDASNAGDTHPNTVFLLGLKITYFGWKK